MVRKEGQVALPPEPFTIDNMGTAWSDVEVSQQKGRICEKFLCIDRSASLLAEDKLWVSLNTFALL